MKEFLSKYQWYFVAAQYFLLMVLTIAGCVPRNMTSVYILVILALGSMLLWVWYYHRLMVEMIVRELQFSVAFYWLTKRKNWKSKKGNVSVVALIQYAYGDMDKAYETIQSFLEQSKKKECPPLGWLKGWKCFQAGDIEQLRQIREACLEQDGNKITLRGQMLGSWVAILEKDSSFTWQEQEEGGSLGQNLLQAYWAGFWYMANGEWKKAIPKFLYVWENGDQTQLAEKARYALEDWGVALPAQKPAPRKAYKKGLIFFTVLTVCTVGLYLLLGNLL